MSTPLEQHQIEIRRNLASWQRKPLLRAVYASFYDRIRRQIDPALPGRIVEIGSGIGNLRDHLPGALGTDLFPNPWIDLACDGYELPFRAGTLSHLVLIDVFHHLESPAAFLGEAERVLHPRGRVILLEPYISGLSRPIYELLHHEPVAWRQAIRPTSKPPRPRHYYAAQGNATRVFFGSTIPDWLGNWSIREKRALAGCAYLSSGGFSGPSLAPLSWRPLLDRLDRLLSRWPRLFGVRCLVCLERRASEA